MKLSESTQKTLNIPVVLSLVVIFALFTSNLICCFLCSDHFNHVCEVFQHHNTVDSSYCTCSLDWMYVKMIDIGYTNNKYKNSIIMIYFSAGYNFKIIHCKVLQSIHCVTRRLGQSYYTESISCIFLLSV